MEIWSNGQNQVVWRDMGIWGGRAGAQQAARGQIWSVFADRRLSGTTMDLFLVMVPGNSMQKKI